MRSALVLPVAESALPARRGGLATGTGAALVVGGLGLADGGYFPTSWGWSALACSWICAIALVLRADLAIPRLGLSFLGALAAFCGWVALSAIWSASPGRAMVETQRGVVYLAGVFAALLLVRRRVVPHLLWGALTGIIIVCGYALGTRLLPERLGSFDPIAGYRLSEPVGYWNALGILAGVGVLLALGFAARSRGLRGRALGAAMTPVLLTSVYFTFGRGTWIALGVGFAAALALDPRRLQLALVSLVLSPACAAAVWLAADSPALTRRDSVVAQAAAEGHRLAAALLGLCCLAALGGVAVGLAERRTAPGQAVRRAGTLALVLAIGAALALPVARSGGPVAVATRAYGSFTTAPTSRLEIDLNRRLFSFSGSGRAGLWRAAIDDVIDHPLLGSGAGSYEQFWLAHRKTTLKVKDAHSLYLETLAELGPLGLGLLLFVLGTPLVAARRARGHPLAPAAFGGYLAFLVHAGADWDWEVTSVTLAALLLGTALVLVSASGQPPRQRFSVRGRTLLSAAAVAVGAFALVGLVSSSALARASDAAARGDFSEAIAQARIAAPFAPWSVEPLRVLGEARLAQGDVESAIESFDRASRRDSDDWSLWLDLARAEQGRARLQALDHAARLNPLSPEVAELRAELGLEAIAASTEVSS